MNNQNSNQNVNSRSTRIAIMGTIPEGAVLVSTNIFSGKPVVFGRKIVKKKIKVKEAVTTRDSDGEIVEEKPAEYETREVVVQKSGLYLKLPWNKNYRIISTQPQPLYTPTSKTNSFDKIPISYNADYMFKVVDPMVYATAFESAKNNTNGPGDIIKEIGIRLDQIVADYVRRKNSEDLYGMPAQNLLLENIEEVDKLREEYGIEVTRLLLTDVKLPLEITQQAEKAKSDEIKRQNDLANARAEEEINKIKAEEIANKIRAWIAAGLSPEAVAKYLCDIEIVNGTNPNTIVLAGEQIGNNSNFDMAAMYSALSSLISQRQNNNTAQTQGSNNIPVQSIPTEPVSDVVPNDAVDKLKQKGLVPSNITYGNVIWSGLPTIAYDFLVKEGYQPPNTNQNSTNYHI